MTREELRRLIDWNYSDTLSDSTLAMFEELRVAIKGGSNIIEFKDRSTELDDIASLKVGKFHLVRDFKIEGDNVKVLLMRRVEAYIQGQWQALMSC